MSQIRSRGRYFPFHNPTDSFGFQSDSFEPFHASYLSPTLEPEKNVTVKPITKLLHLTVLIVLGNSLLVAADRGTLVREAIIYLSPDTTSSKLGQVERGRELILLDKSRNWLHVEALLGSPLPPDPPFLLEDQDQGKPILGSFPAPALL